MRNTSNSFVREPEGKNCLTDLSVNGRIILKWVVKTWDVRMQTGLSYAAWNWDSYLKETADYHNYAIAKDVPVSHSYFWN
jgi:hypothetical protein